MCGVGGLASLRQCLCVPRASIHPASHHRHLNVCVYLGEVHTPFPVLVGVRAFLVGGGCGGVRVEGEGVAGMEGKWWWSEMRERGQGEGGWSGEPPVCVCLVCATFLPSSLTPQFSFLTLAFSLHLRSRHLPPRPVVFSSCRYPAPPPGNVCIGGVGL